MYKGKTKLKFYQNLSNYFDEMNKRKRSGKFYFEEDPFSKDAQRISKKYQEVILLMKVLQSKPEVRGLNFNYYGLY